MKIFNLAIYILAAFLVILIGAYGYYGGFKSVNPAIEIVGGETLVFEKVKGDYRQSGAVSERVYNRLKKEFEVVTERGFGIYYDNPKEVDMPKLRADIGCILEPEDLNKVEDIKLEFYVEELPKEEYLVAQFPHKGFMSIMVGIMKVYPAMHNYMKTNGYNVNNPVMEIWDIKNGVITYRQKIGQKTTAES